MVKELEIPGDLSAVGDSDQPQSTIFDRIAFVGNYLPRQCGIATFTTDLCQAIASAYPQVECVALAMNDIPGGYDYPPRVHYVLDQNKLLTYRCAADYLNLTGINLVCLQHEYGIYGGKAGEYILTLLRNLEMPVVTTLHTVLRNPGSAEFQVMRELADISDRLVVMSSRAAHLLMEVYQVPQEKIDQIPHGIPDVPFVDPNFYKDKYNVEGKMVLLTFGLLSPNKGLENVIRALPTIVEQHPEAVYLIVGATHPHVKRSEGETYRHALQRLAQELGVASHLIFHNRFVSLDELVEFIGAADIYITPYLNPEQIVSGTLAYTVGAGKAVVSTPYWYAQELLGEARGLLVPFNQPQAIAEKVLQLLNDAPLRHAMRKRAYALGREMIWPEVARQYMYSFERARDSRQVQPRALLLSRPVTGPFDQWSSRLPDVKIDHMLRMTSDTGIYQHAIYNIPNFSEGYVTDDNARALIVALQLDEHGLVPEIDVQALASRYLAFLWYAFDAGNKRFRNVLSFDHRWQEKEGSDDSQGRAVWSLGMVLGRSNHEGLRRLASRMFPEALPPILNMDSPRAWAFALLGIAEYLGRYPGDRGVISTGELLAEKLVALYRRNCGPDWRWFEPSATYSNASLPQALLQFSPYLPQVNRRAVDELALEALQWLLEVQISERGYFSPIGTAGFYQRGGIKACFDQQPIEACNMVVTCLAAYQLTGGTNWLRSAQLAFAWFLGQNDLGLPLYDTQSGGCCDGLHPNRVNRNQGAESTLAYLRARLAFRSLETTIDPAAKTVPQFNPLKLNLLPK